MTQPDALELLQKIRYDLTAAQAKITDLQRILATIPMPEREWIACPTCGIRCHDERHVSEHVYVVHDGPRPAHYRESPHPGNPIAPSTSDSGSILPAE